MVGAHLSTYGLHDVIRHAEHPWIHVEPNPVADLVINRTDRWVDRGIGGELNYDMIMRQFKQSRSVFIGTDDEWDNWVDRYGDIIPRHLCENALDVARVIAGSLLLACTPSFAAALACAMRHTTVLECAPWFNAGWERPECAIMHSGSKMTSSHLSLIMKIGNLVRSTYPLCPPPIDSSSPSAGQPSSSAVSQ